MPPCANLDSDRPNALTRSSLRPLSTPPAQPPSVAPKSCQEVKFLSRASALSEAETGCQASTPVYVPWEAPTSTRFMDDIAQVRSFRSRAKFTICTASVADSATATAIGL